MKEVFYIVGSLSQILASTVFLVVLFKEKESIFNDITNTLIFVVILILIGNYLKED